MGPAVQVPKSVQQIISSSRIQLLVSIWGWICHVTHVVSAILSTWPIRFWELKFAKKHLRCWVLDLSSLELCLRYGSPRVSRNQVWYESTTFLWLTCPGSWNWCRKPCVLEMIQQQKKGDKGRWSEQLKGGSFIRTGWFWRCVYCCFFLYVIRYSEQVWISLTASCWNFDRY